MQTSPSCNVLRFANHNLLNDHFYIPIRARVNGDIIEPLEQIGLPEGQEVLVTILVPTNREAFQRSDGQWTGTLDAEAMICDIHAKRDRDRLSSESP